MKKIYSTTMLLCLLTTTAIAKDDLLTFSFSEALEFGYQEGILDPAVKFYLAGQKHGPISKNMGKVNTNKKTNAFGKSDAKACQWVLLSALIALQQKALSLKANAVIDIKSNFKNREFSSNEQYQCGAGTLMAGVALKGEVVEL